MQTRLVKYETKTSQLAIISNFPYNLYKQLHRIEITQLMFLKGYILSWPFFCADNYNNMEPPKTNLSNFSYA